MKLQMLLVVIDPTKQAQPALERAAWLARQSGAALELLVCEYHATLESSSLFDRKSRETAREHLLQERRDWLESLALPLRNEGLRVQTEVRWGRPLHKVVLERASELQPDLLFKAASEHGKLRQLLLSNSCWELIRHATVPLWLVHHGAGRPYQRLCAAIDPLHSFDKPAALDHRLLTAASELSSLLKLEAHALHCYAPLPPSMLFDAELVAHYPQYLQNSGKEHRAALEQLQKQYPQVLANGHLIEGYAEEEIPKFVREQSIDLLLMGAVSRSHVESALIGNTAERVLEQVDCDLLVFNSGPKSSVPEK
ncbi:universal stress protein [Pseudomonas sp. N040]|uniref:universal stress protein n=1 Tax=Pseudomonas sp. N040 TaxID=2785325 RepID=UPI0018A28FE0|nr:universal stress protein [Pseudomonas sp. N040]MBF7730524.1 universal stress protein [Pseudomonas sp. N040]MBW7014168.1 universal stress protein [Pseudomonas sp. N040]